MAQTYQGEDIVIIDAARSILGAENGSLQSIPASRLGSRIVSGLVSRLESIQPAFKRELITHFILGLGSGAGVGQNLPRQIAEQSGLASIQSGFIVNELCGSSLEAVMLAHNSLKLHEYPLVLAGGLEMPSRAPYLISRQQLIEWQERKVGELEALLRRADIQDNLWCALHDVHTIVHAEETTAQWVKNRGLDPEEFKRKIDEYAVLSNQRALKAQTEQAFKEEIILIPGSSQQDEIPAPKNMERLQRRQGTQFTPQGFYLSMHNSPPLANGAAFLLLSTMQETRNLGLPVLGRITAFARARVAEEAFLLAPIQAVKRLLASTGTAIADYDLLELNTAFGSQILFNQTELELDMEKVNPWGDCLALGHPVGAAGARLLTTLLYGLKRTGKRRGLVAICLGGGHALAMAVERL